MIPKKTFYENLNPFSISKETHKKLLQFNNMNHARLLTWIILGVIALYMFSQVLLSSCHDMDRSQQRSQSSFMEKLR